MSTRKSVPMRKFDKVLAILAIVVTVALIVAPAIWSQQQPTSIRLVQLLPGASTLCGVGNTGYRVRQDVTFMPGNLASGLARYGECFNVACAGERKCITGESPRAAIQEWMVYQMVGCHLDPGESVTHGFNSARWVSVNGPSGVGEFMTTNWEEQIEDAGLTGLEPRMKSQYAAACLSPQPTPTPAPTAAPQPTPAPTVEPMPAATPAPTATPCPSPPPCPSCPTYQSVDEPSYVREAIEAGLNALGRRWREKVEMARRWRREHPGPHYSLVSSGRITESIEPWTCAPDYPTCESDKVAYRARYGLTASELP